MECLLVVMLTAEKERYLREIYFDAKQPASFAGLGKLYKFVKTRRNDISKEDIRKWLSKQSSYTLYRRVIRKFRRPKVMVPSKGYMVDADTANYAQYSDANDGYKYFAVFIDVLSHYLYTVPLKSLTSSEMVNALKKVFEREKPTFLRTDRGSEFAGAANKFLKAEDVKQIKTSEHSKANYAERVIRTVKGKLAKYMVHNKSRRWIDALPEVTDSYNKTYHRTIKMSPVQALETKDAILWKSQYNPEPKKQREAKKKPPSKNPRTKNPFKLKVGDVVRLSKIPGTYDKETDKKWTDELFTITTRTLNQGIPKYEVKDFANDPIIDKFSTHELQKVFVDQDTQYDVDKILRRRKKRGKTQVLVHWVGWPSKFDSWIDEDQVKDFTK